MTRLHTSRWVYGFDHNVLFNSGRVVCGMHKHNNPAETAVVVYGLDQQRGQGEGKGAEEQDSESLSLTIGSYGRGCARNVRVSLRLGTVLSRKVVSETAHSPVQSDSPLRPQRNRGGKTKRG